MEVPSSLRRHWWIFILGGALLFLTADSLHELVAVRRIATVAEALRPAPARDDTSPTGQRWGQRNQILESTDGYHWVMQTQQMVANGEWRVRHVDYDNAPFGRDVHWASPLHWWLAAVAWIDHLLTGRSVPVAIEHAGTYAGAWLLGIFLLAIVPLTARRFGPWPAALLSVGLVTVLPFTGEYGSGSIDHHGIAGSLALLTVLFLLAGNAGWTKAGDLISTRRWFVASGIAGAAGLWINAATQIPVLFGVGLGALLATGWLARRAAKNSDIQPAPGLWRVWGFAGGAASLVFYLVEYFPSHFSLRLEVNHPLFALAWAGAGDLLSRICTRLQTPPQKPAGNDRLGFILSLAAVVLPAVLALSLPQQTFVVADKFLWTLHVDYIEEFSSLAARWRSQASSGALRFLLVHVNLLPLLTLPGLAWLLREKLAPATRALLAVSLPPALLLSALAWGQIRWLHVSCALWLAVLVAMAVIVTTAGFRWTTAGKIAAALFVSVIFLPYPLDALTLAWRTRGETGVISRENLRQCVLRDYAYWLRRRTGDEGAVVLSGPTASTELIYHGGFKGVGTLYWENISGLRALSDIFGASTPEQALAQLRQRGVTHLVFFPWGSFVNEAARLARGLRASDPVPTGAFARDLLDSGRGMPDWVRPLVYQLPDTPEYKNDFVLTLEIVPEQSAADAAVRRAQFLAAFGNTEDASHLIRDVLAQNPSHLPALIQRAEFQRQGHDQPGFGETMLGVHAALAGAPALELGDRILLTLELAAARDPARAQEQLRSCWTDATERNLRRLPAQQLTLLLNLTRDLKVAPDDPAKLALAAGLLADESPRPSPRAP